MTNDRNPNRFDALLDELMFNIFTCTPDPIILPFLRNHFPYLLNTREPGGWTSYPPGFIPEPQKGMHSLKLLRHPFINLEHLGARIDLQTHEWIEWAPGIERIRVWIYFASEVQAEAGNNYIVEKFRQTGAHVDVSSFTAQKRTVIKHTTPEEEWKFLSIELRKEVIEQIYSVGILFYGDEGNPW
jgi:hypothetical protein